MDGPGCYPEFVRFSQRLSSIRDQIEDGSLEQDEDCDIISAYVEVFMTWEYQIDFPPDGGAGGASFYVTQNAAWEQVGLVWNMPGNGDTVNLNYNAVIIDIGSALDNTSGRQGIASDVGVHFNPFTVLIRMQYKGGPSPQNAALPWCSSALNLLYDGPQNGVLNTKDPGVAGRPNLIIIGAEDNPDHKQQVGEGFTYQNLVMYISYAGPYGAKVTALNVNKPPCR